VTTPDIARLSDQMFTGLQNIEWVWKYW